MKSKAAREATHALAELARGDPSAAERLFPLVYEELHALAGGLLAHERAGHTLQTTALVHEAYLRLIGREDLADADRTRFVGVAAQAIRRVLVDHARRRGAVKRGSGAKRVLLDDAARVTERSEIDLLALEEALEELAALNERQARVVELRFYGGLDVAETAEVLGVSPRTVEGDWSMAKAWLRPRLRGRGADPGS